MIAFLFMLGIEFAEAQTYNCRITTQTATNATTVSTRVLVENRSRRCLVVQNAGTTTILVRFDSAHSQVEGVRVPAQERWEPPIVPVNAIYIKAITGTSIGATIVEGQ